MRSHQAIVIFLLSICATGAAYGQAAPGNPLKGKSLFQERCSVCHAISMDGSAQGPNLSGVVGRPSAAVQGFSYTRELRDAKLIWNEATLDKYLANPGGLVPGTMMAVAVPDADERRSLIAFLRTVQGPAIQPARTNAATTPQNSNDPEDWRNSKPG